MEREKFMKSQMIHQVWGDAYSSQSEPAVTFPMPLEVIQNFQD